VSTRDSKGAIVGQLTELRVERVGLFGRLAALAFAAHELAKARRDPV